MPTNQSLASLSTLIKPRPVEATLSRHMLLAARRALLLVVLLAAPIVAFYSIGDVEFGVGRLDYAPAAPHHVEASTVGPAGSLVERHDCWTGDAPADMVGVLPGHVVVSTSGEAPRYAGSRVVGLALQQLFDGVDHGLVVHGFCR